MLNGKLYLINSPEIIQSALRNPDLSFDPFLLNYWGKLWGLEKEVADVIRPPHVLKAGVDNLHTTLLGAHMKDMNMKALEKILEVPNGVGEGDVLRVSDSWDFFRDIAFRGITAALYGSKSPFEPHHAELVT